MGKRIKMNENVFGIELLNKFQVGVLLVMVTLLSKHQTNSTFIKPIEINKRATNSNGITTQSLQVPVIDGVIAGRDANDIRNKPSDRFRVDTNLISTDETNNTTTISNNNHTSIQITPNVSACNTNSVQAYQSLTGYIHLTPSQSLFFWFLEARNNPDEAPLVLWLNGGPGSSSMIGLFQENGPCRIKLDSSGFDANPQSWNENANMIYIDQPVGTGYSYGSSRVKNTNEAMADLYEALQLLLSDPYFSKFVGRPFGVWTESYGGHYAPVLVDYILQMNQGLTNQNQTKRIPIPINSLGIGNGLTNALVQYFSYISYAKSNPYNQTLVSQDVIDGAVKDLNAPITGCHDLIKTCQSTLKARDCRSAQSFCNRQILSTLIGERDVYDVRQPDPSSYPPSLTPILNNPKFKSSIGVPSTVNWTESNENVYMEFFSSGDWMLDSSKQLERVINSGIRTLIFVGDADFIVNYQGIEALLASLNTRLSKSFENQTFSNWYIDDELAGVYKTSETLTYLRIFEAGHEVPAYGKGKLAIGQAAKLFFDQTISNHSISSSKSDNKAAPAQMNVDKSQASSLCLNYSIMSSVYIGLLLSFFSSF